MSAAEITVRDVCVTRGTFTLMVDNLTISPHEVFAILGTTGSGKTVLMETIAGVFEPCKGEVCIDGVAVTQIPVSKRGIGVLYQDYALFPHMSVYENIAYGLKCHNVSNTEIDTRVREMMHMFSLEHIADQYPGVISGGEAQRTALARALVMQPRILLLDEPFSALDPVTKTHMYEMFRTIKERFACTIVVVTHDFHEAQVLADRVGIVLDGRMQSECASDELFTQSHNARVCEFLGIK